MTAPRCGFNFPAGQLIRGSGLYSATVDDIQDASIEYFWGNGWEGATGTWFVYYRKCIDRCAALGLNALKIQANITVTKRGTATANQLYARWAQLISYAKKMGLKIMANMVLDYDYSFAFPSTVRPTSSEVETFANGWLTYMVNAGLIQNITHIDYQNEQMYNSLVPVYYPNITSQPNLPANIPVTTSFSSVTISSANSTWTAGARPYADVVDVHYYNIAIPTGADYDATFGTDNPSYELCVGEFGSPSLESRAQEMADIMAFGSSRPKIRGWFHWTVWDRSSQGLWHTTSALTYDGGIDAGALSSLTYPLTPDVWPPTDAINYGSTVIPVMLSAGPAVTPPNPPQAMRVSDESKMMVWNGAFCTNSYASTNLYRVSGVSSKTKILNAGLACMYDDSANWSVKQYGYQATVVDGGAHESSTSALYVPTRLPRRMTRRRIQPVLH